MGTGPRRLYDSGGTRAERRRCRNLLKLSVRWREDAKQISGADRSAVKD